MGLWRYALRELLQHPGRSIFTFIGIAVGVAAAVASLVTVQAARGHYRELFTGVAGDATLEVYAPGEAGFDPGVAKLLAHIPGVADARPEVQGVGGMPSWYCSAPVIVRGRQSDGEPSPGENEVLVPAALAEAHGMKPGGRLRLWGSTGQADLTVTTRTAAHSLRHSSGGGVDVSLSTAQQLFGLGGNVNLVRIVLADTAHPPTVRDAVAAALPPGLAVREPAGRADITGGLRAAALHSLTGLTAIALASAGYIVFGLAQLSLLARRSELAVLRTLGASSRQAEGVFFRHAFLLGAGGGGLGTLLGFALAWGISTGAGRAMGLAIATPAFGREYAALGLGTGLGVSLAAIWLPARRLCRQPPLDLLRAGAGTPAHRSRPRWSAVIAAVGLALGVALLAAISTGGLPPVAGQELFPPALVLTLAGATGLVTPLLPRGLARLEGAARAAFGVEGALAIRQLASRPDRTARTSGVVFVAVAMAVGFGHCVLNTLADVRGWADRAIPAHFLVRGGPPDPGFVLNVPLPESLGDPLRSLNGVAGVEQISFIPTTVNGAPVLVLARTFSPGQPLPLDLRSADAGAIQKGLADGQAVLADSLANALRVGVGDSISLATPGGPRPVRVAGVVTEFASGGRALYLDWKAAASLFGPCGVHVFLVTARPDQRSAAGGELARYCDRHGLFLQRNAELRQVVDDLTRGLTGGLWALLAVMLAVAALGVATTVLATAREQQRDVLILVSIGMTPQRIGRAFRLQTAFLILGGVPAGVLCGLALAVGLNHAICGLWGYRVPFQIQWEFLLESVASTVFVASLAGLGFRIGWGARQA